MSPSPDDVETIRLDEERVWCDRHVRPLLETLPLGRAIMDSALLMLFDAFTRDERARAMAPTGRQISALSRLVEECSPLCCFLGDVVVSRVIEDARLGRGVRADELPGTRVLIPADDELDGPEA